MADKSPLYVSYGLENSVEDERLWYEERSRSAQAACEMGDFYYQQNKLKESFDCFGRAERLSGDASNVMLSYAMVALELGYYDICQPRFRLLRERYNLREAMFGEVWCLYRQRKELSSARHLGRALSRFYISEGLATVADHLAQVAGRPGWATLSNRGVLSVQAQERVRLSLDGKALGDVEPGQIDLSVWDQSVSRTWATYAHLSVCINGRHVLGSPFDIRSLTACDGVVTAQDGHVEGWLWYPAEPDFVPTLWIERCRAIVNFERNDTLKSERPLFRPWHFSFPLSSLPGRGEKVVDIRETHRRLLRGAPLDPRIAGILAGDASALSGFPPIMARREVLSRPEKNILNQASCAVIIPVYQHYGLTRHCVMSVLDTVPAHTAVIVINDASPDRNISQFLADLSDKNKIILRTNLHNRGYPFSINVGLSMCRGHDVVLLNSDTMVFSGWVERLQAWVQQPGVGTATPFSNDGGLTSYPHVGQSNGMVSFREARELDQLCQHVDVGSDVISLPTGNGFCLAISVECLHKTGLMRDQIFAQGYAEENDFCLRAAQEGFRHVAATDVYVWHRGHASFQGSYHGLLERNLALLNALYPEYEGDVQTFEAQNPLALKRRFLDEARLKECVSDRGCVVFIQHKMGGGVARVVRERSRVLRQEGCLTLSLVPTKSGCALEVCGHEEAMPNLSYTLPEELDHVWTLLRGLEVRHLEWHHLAGHAPWIRELHRALEVPYDVFVHDHIWFCPRIALLTGDGLYCGEPSAAACQKCVDRWGEAFEEGITIPFLLERSQHELAAARSVIAPSYDAARRLERHISGLSDIEVRPLENDAAIVQSSRAPVYHHQKRRIGVLGGISRWKGYDILLELGRYIQEHQLPLELVLIGNTANDDALMKAGITVTGAYHEDDVLSLIKIEEIDIGFIPSVAPETWCYVLGWLWKAGLDVLSFDIGASSERIKKHGRGKVIPLGVSVSFLAEYILNYQTRL